MTVIKKKARDLAALSVEEIWNLADGKYEVAFDDGKVMTHGRDIIFSWYIWGFHRQYKHTPLLTSHLLTDERVGTGSHIDLLTAALWDTYDAYVAKGEVKEENTQSFIDNLSRLSYEITSQMYNDFTRNLEAYVTSISAFDFLDVIDHPEVSEAIRTVKPNYATTTHTVDHAYARVKKILMDPTQLPNNGVAKAARSGLVSLGQILQCVAVRGYTTDIDSNIFPEPILRGFFPGLRSLEDMMKESRSAAKALFFQKDPMRKSEYFNRNIQLSAATLSDLHIGDCGSDHYIDFSVRPGDLNPGVVGMYHLNEKGKLEVITERHKHLIGKTIKIRSVFGCKHPNPYGICSTCFGDLALSVPAGTNIGHFSAAVVQSEVGQRILSTKHEDASSTVETHPLDNYTAKFLTLNADTNQLTFNKTVKADKVELIISAEDARNLYDVTFVDNVSRLVTTRITEVEEAQIVMKKGGKESLAVVRVANGPRLASMTHELLEHARSKGWEMNENGDYVIDITDWDHTKPAFELPMKHHSMLDYMKVIEQVIKGTGDRNGIKTLPDYEDVSEALAAFYDLVTSKMEVSLSHLQVVALSTMARDMEHDDFRLPKPGYTGKFSSYKLNMMMRSLSAMMAFQRQGPTIQSVRSYNVKVRPKHPLDPLLMG